MKSSNVLIEQIHDRSIQHADVAIRSLRSLLAAARHGEDAIQAEVIRQLTDSGEQPAHIRRNPATIQTVSEFVPAGEINPQERLTIATKRHGRGGGNSLLLWAHPDGMPFDGAHGWEHDPFAGEVEGGRIYGWGIADDLSGVATLLMVSRILQELEISLAGDLILASTPSKDHASGILAAIDAGFTADAGIYLHPAESGNGLGDIKALAPGMLRCRLTVAGRPPETAEPNHTLYSGGAVHPLTELACILEQLENFEHQRNNAHSHSKLRELTGRSTSMMVSTVNAGDSISRIPASAEAVVTFSVPPGDDLLQLQSDVQQVVAEAAAEREWLQKHPPVITWLFGTSGVEVDERGVLYRTVEKAIENVTGQTPRYYAGHIASEIRQPILNHGIDAVGIGPRSGSLTQAGGADEWLDIEDYLRMIAVCTIAAIEWCGVAD